MAPVRRYVGEQGTAHGSGLYFGLSDHVPVFYNKGFPTGTAIIGLMLTKEIMGWSSEARGNKHGGFSTTRDQTWSKSHKTFSLAAPVAGMDNAVVLYEPALVLPLGLAFAHPAKPTRQQHRQVATILCYDCRKKFGLPPNTAIVACPFCKAHNRS